MKIVILTLILTVLSTIGASAQAVVKPGTCEIIVASRKSVPEAQRYIRQLPNKKFAKIFKATNGWYAISIGALKPNEEKPVMDKWKRSGKIPKDAFCSTGRKYTTLIDWQSGKKISVSTRAEGVFGRSSTTKVSSSKTDRDGHPFVMPGICRLIYVQSKSGSGLLEQVRSILDKSRTHAYFIGLYQLKNGDYVAAETGRYARKAPKRYRKNQPIAVRNARLFASNGKYPRTARCTDGSDIARDTGSRLIKEGKKGSNLLLKGLVAGASALQKSGSSSSSSRSSQSNSSTSAYRAINVNGRSFSGICNDGRGAFSGSYYDGMYTVSASAGGVARKTILNSNRNIAIKRACGG